MKTNIPYVKEFDKDGKLLNPIEDGIFQNYYPNRSQRKTKGRKIKSQKKGVVIIKDFLRDKNGKINGHTFLKMKRVNQDINGKTICRFE